MESIIKLLSNLFHWNETMASQDIETTPVTPVIPTPAPPPAPDMITRWAQAISKWEGATPASNNPGNLKYSTLTASWGATKGREALDGGYFCQFSTPQEGFTALVNFLTLACEHELIISNPWPCTLEAFTIRYAGNPPQGYIEGIAQDMGVSTSVDIATFLPSNAVG